MIARDRFVVVAAFVLASFAADSASAKQFSYTYVSDLESGYGFYEELRPFLAVDLHVKMRTEHPEVRASCPSLTASRVGLDFRHGSGVLVRMTLGLQPWEDVGTEPALEPNIRLVPLLYDDHLAETYRVAIANGVRIHNFSIGIDPVPEAAGTIREMAAMVKESPNAYFVVAAGNEGIAESKTLEKFPQGLALSNLPNVLFAGNAKTSDDAGNARSGKKDSPFPLSTSNWTAASRFFLCVDCESTTGSAAYLSRLLAHLTQRESERARGDAHARAVSALSKCLPSAYFAGADGTPKGSRPYYSRTSAFARKVAECAAQIPLPSK